MKDHLADSAGGARGGGNAGHQEFVEFRRRLTRLVDSLVGLRGRPHHNELEREAERVDITLESDAVIVEIRRCDAHVRCRHEAAAPVSRAIWKAGSHAPANNRNIDAGDRAMPREGRELRDAVSQR